MDTLIGKTVYRGKRPYRVTDFDKGGAFWLEGVRGRGWYYRNEFTLDVPVYETVWDDDVANHDYLQSRRDAYYSEVVHQWVHGDRDFLWHMNEVEATPFHPKPSRNIRAEKTREYRKRRPRVRSVSGLITCLLR